MIIGIPKETWHDEKRVALTPAGAYALTKRGHQVVVQADAGLACSFTNEAYVEAGATLAFDREVVYGRADVVVKVMPLLKDEVKSMAPGKTVLSFLHFNGANSEMLQKLIDLRCTAIGYNLMDDEDGELPVLMTMSEIAGMLLPQIAGRYLETPEGGRGALLGRIAGIPASTVVIIGAGMVGRTAARAFSDAGTEVLAMDNDLSRLRQLELHTRRSVNTAIASHYNIERYVKFADVLVGAVMIRGQQSPHVVREAQVKQMRPGGVVIDVSIDQGGCIETIRPTTHSDPVYEKHGLLHYAVPNIPALVARTASHALNNVLVSFVQQIADQETAAFRENEILRRGIYIYEGKCTQSEVARLFGWPSFQIDELIRQR